MSVTRKITDRSKRMVLNPTVMKWISDDRVMKAAEGVMDARTRVKAAWKVLLDGHDLPAVDPALDDYIGETAPKKNGHGGGLNGKNGTNGANGHSAHAKNGNGH